MHAQWTCFLRRHRAMIVLVALDSTMCILGDLMFVPIRTSTLQVTHEYLKQDDVIS